MENLNYEEIKTFDFLKRKIKGGNLTGFEREIQILNELFKTLDLAVISAKQIADLKNIQKLNEFESKLNEVKNDFEKRFLN